MTSVPFPVSDRSSKTRLAAAGISRFDELAAAAPERLAKIAGVPLARADEWVDQARSLV